MNFIQIRDIHLIGKDILGFHAVYYATMIVTNIPLPKRVYGHDGTLEKKNV